MSYIQGYVTPVSTNAREAYLAHAQVAAAVFLELGASQVVDCWGDDVPHGEVTDFYRAVDARPDETIVFGWMRWPSKGAAEQAMTTAMTDPRLSPETNPMPFDGRRMIFGGFAPLLELGAPIPGGYIDGFVAAVPTQGRDRFEAFARACDPIFMEFGAVWIMEGWGVDVPVGTQTDLHRAVQRKADESVLFSWVQWPDKATRDAGSASMMEDPRFAKMEMPFDGRRLIYGGFDPMLGL